MKPVLVLIPGWGGNESLWEYPLQHLSDIVDCKVIILDQQKSRDQMMEHVLKNTPQQFILAGQSMGGWVAMKTAAKAPERISKLILANTWASPDPKLNELQKDVLRDLKNGEVDQVISRHLPFALHPDSLQKPDLIAKFHKMFEHCKTGTLIDQMQAMLNDYVSLPLLSKISSPTLIIHGREDQLFPTSEQEIIHKGIKQSQLKIIEKCGHCSPLEKPEETTALMRAFITQNGG
ncbi:MAG: alpha/beta hydrolase [Parachlamydiales bacterium]|nr:alpha/beta hydrolase [Verrucomicrobiota bacterium]MBX3720127.1 alpha/beta hydrolase [Candidatus Acheromyda pituitae]